MAQVIDNKRFLHLMPAERLIWLEWLKVNGEKWSMYTYDVHVGEGVPPDPDQPPNIQAIAESITRYRIDVMAIRDGVPWIFEVKPFAGVSAIGQLLCYKQLYRWTYQYDRELKLALVVGTLNKDMIRLCHFFDIKPFIVGVA